MKFYQQSKYYMWLLICFFIAGCNNATPTIVNLDDVALAPCEKLPELECATYKGKLYSGTIVSSDANHRSEIQYLNGLRNGSTISTHTIFGSVKYNYQAGLLDGWQFNYVDKIDEKLKYKELFKNGNKIEAVYYDKDGVIRSSYKFDNGYEYETSSYTNGLITSWRLHHENSPEYHYKSWSYFDNGVLKEERYAIGSDTIYEKKYDKHKTLLYDYKKDREKNTLTVKHFWPNSQLKYLQYYIPLPDLDRTGVWKNYCENGTLEYIKPYKNGQLEGVAEGYYCNGQLKSRRIYKNDKLEGVAEEYYSNGQLRSRTIYKQDKPIKQKVKNYTKAGELDYIKSINEAGELDYYKAY